MVRISTTLKTVLRISLIRDWRSMNIVINIGEGNNHAVECGHDSTPLVAGFTSPQEHSNVTSELHCSIRPEYSLSPPNLLKTSHGSHRRCPR